MKLRGVLDSSLGGFICIRGYARLGEIARCSVADESYQRDLIQTQQQRIREFLSDGENLFFPEVTLSCRLQYDFDKPRAASGTNPLADLLQGKKFKSNVNGIEIVQRTIKYESKEDTRIHDLVRIASLEIPESLIDEGLGPLSRIDGNHRISAHNLEPDFASLICPFCVILFESSDDNRRKSKTIFHNVNFKTIPLTVEQHLRVVYEDIELFPDAMLEESLSFGPSYVLARRAFEEINLEPVPAVEAAVGDQRRTLFQRLFELLKEYDQPTEGLDLPYAFDLVNMAYRNDDALADRPCFGLLLAFIYFAVTDPRAGRFNAFRRWVQQNHIGEMHEADAASLIAIFDRVFTARSRTIFVSMQFSDDTKATYDAIHAAVDEINDEHGPGLDVEEIRIDKLDKGHSFRINSEILELLDNAGLLIADLTHGNKNVYHEIGYMMGLNRGRARQQSNFILIVDGTDQDRVRRDVGFNLAEWQQIRFNDTLGLKNQLKTSISNYYKLGVAD